MTSDCAAVDHRLLRRHHGRPRGRGLGPPRAASGYPPGHGRAVGAAGRSSAPCGSCSGDLDRPAGVEGLGGPEDAGLGVGVVRWDLPRQGQPALKASHRSRLLAELHRCGPHVVGGPRHSVSTEPPRQLDVEGVDVDIADILKELGGPGLGQRLGQLVAPILVLGLQSAELGHGRGPPLRPELRRLAVSRFPGGHTSWRSRSHGWFVFSEPSFRGSPPRGAVG